MPDPGYVLESISGCGGEFVDGVLRFVATSDCTVTVVFALQTEPIPALGRLGLGATPGLLALIGLIALRRGAPSTWSHARHGGVDRRCVVERGRKSPHIP